MNKVIKILYEDADLLFCVKPVGVVSQLDSVGRENMVDLLSAQTGCDIYPLHRLDTKVGGVMVFAKNKTAAAKISALVADHNMFVKEYLAVVEGVPDKEGVLEDFLFHDKVKNKTYVVKNERNGVKKAKLKYETLNTNGVCSLLRIRLYTGRTHQIRAQFASRGFPIAGDRKYGASALYSKLHLFSVGISFVSPINDEFLSFYETPSSDEWQVIFE